MYKTHSIAAIVACTAIVPTLNSLKLVDNSNVYIVGLIFAGGILGALLPDIDSPTSKIRRIIRKLITGNPNPETNQSMPNHRREPHMPLIWAGIFAVLLLTVTQPMMLALIYGLMTGVYSHLAIDMLNPAGIPLFGPVNRKKVSIFFIKANSFGESVFAVCSIAFELYLLFGLNYIHKLLLI